MTGNSPKIETLVLNHYPRLRSDISCSSSFLAWIGELTSVDIDGETLYLRGGDMLVDRDQAMFEWARRNGLLTDRAIAEAMREKS